MDVTFEKLTLEHAEDVINILNYYIKNTTFAYSEETIGIEDFYDFIDEKKVHCSFVIKNNQEKVIGFCILNSYNSLSTFSESAKTMYFIDKEYTGKGIGTLVLNKLEDEAGKKGIKKLLANVSSENVNSIKFHQKNGFFEYGRLKDIGKKFGRYFSILWMGKEIC